MVVLCMLRALPPPHVYRGSDPGPPQRGQPTVADLGIRITHGHHHPLDAARNDEGDAWWGAFLEMAARLQRDIQRRAAGPRARLSQGYHLGMGPSGLPVIPRADDRALAHDDRAPRRSRAGLAGATPGQRKGPCHESLVGLSMGFRQRDASDESAGGSPSVPVALDAARD